MSKPYAKISHKEVNSTEMLPYTELSNQPRADLVQALPLELPFSLHIEPTNVCNFSCVSCPQSLPTYKQDTGYFQFMDWELYRKIIDEISSLGQLKALKLFGYGESLLHPKLAQMIEYAKSKDVATRIEITTNASRLTPEMSASLIKAGLDYLRVSIYGVDQKKHEAFTRRKVSIQQIRKNLQDFVSIRTSLGAAGPFLYVKIMEIASPQERQEFVDQFSEIGDELAVEVMHNMSGVDGVDEKLGLELQERPQKRRCPLPFYQAAIGANGDMTICCIDWSFSSKVGNLQDSSFSELWRSEKFNAIRRMILNDEIGQINSCKNCTWSWSSTDSLDEMADADLQRLVGAYR